MLSLAAEPILDLSAGEFISSIIRSAHSSGWKTRGWAEKFGMPLGDRYGVGDTPEQVGSFPEVAAEIVAGYRADVLESVEPVIRSLSEADLETTNPDRNLLHPRPAPTFN